MAHPSHRTGDGPDGDGDLANSLQRLTITTPATASSPSSAKTPRSPRPPRPSPLKPVVDNPPSSPRRPGSAIGSPLRSSSVSAVSSSRSATPTLLRKASINSLRSANDGFTPSRRASSANILSPRPRSGRSPLRSMSPEPPEKPIPTPNSVASAHFQAELDVHHAPEPTRRAETLVVLQDACYGHRFSRPRTSRAQLSTIVERPERIKACVLGVSAAYVRLGERHQDGAFPIGTESDAASLPSIPFRIQKSARRLSLGSQTVTNVHGTKWMEEFKLMCDTAEAKLAGGGKELQRPDIDRGQNAEAPEKFHEGDLYLCAESLEAIEGALGGVCDAVDAVFAPQGPQRAFVAIRPPGHHCSASHPSGFCWINNVHVGIMHAVLSHGLTHAAIIDFDLHHGDGSQSIAWQHNARGVGLAKNAAWWKKTSIGYFSLHDINSYPCEMGDEDKVRNASICIDSAHGQSIWNVHLQPWKTEAEFWALYESKYVVLLEKTRAYLKSHTERLRASALNSKAAIFLSAGFDASEHEGAGMQRHSVNVPTEFYARFTRDVVRIAAEEGTSVEGRIISVLEGGYSDRALCSGVLSHLCGLAGDGPSTRDQEIGSLAPETPGQKPIQRARKDSCASERGSRRYESSWWSPAELEQLEATLTAPVPVPKTVRTSPPPTYSSPTQASQARVVNPKNRRSVSGLSPVPSNGVPRLFFEPPPPPEVPWTVATLELSKLLIPGARQTASCTAEELNAEASRARRERQAALAQSAASVAGDDRPPTRMGLRERKQKAAPVIDDGIDRNGRRKTVAGPVLTSDTDKQFRSSRRLSAASTVMSSESADSTAPGASVASIRGNSKADIRPESSMSVAGSSGSSTLNVKKTRAPAKKEAVPRAPRGTKKATAAGTGAGQAAPPPAPAKGTTTPNGPSASKAGDDVDKLSGEMKKIKITVITKAQKEARERERSAREKLLHTKTVSVPSPPANDAPAPAPPSPSNAQHLSSPTPSPAPPPQQLETPSPQHSNLPTPALSTPLASPPPTSPLRTPLPPSSPPPAASSDMGSSPITSPRTTTAGDNFIAYRPPGPVPEGLVQQQKPLQWLPPNVCATPGQSPAKRGEVVPTFSATGVIPFAPRGAAAQGAPAAKGVNGNGEGGK